MEFGVLIWFQIIFGVKTMFSNFVWPLHFQLARLHRTMRELVLNWDWLMVKYSFNFVSQKLFRLKVVHCNFVSAMMLSKQFVTKWRREVASANNKWALKLSSFFRTLLVEQTSDCNWISNSIMKMGENYIFSYRPRRSTPARSRLNMNWWKLEKAISRAGWKGEN